MWQDTWSRYHAAVAPRSPLVLQFATNLIEPPSTSGEAPVIAERYRTFFGPNDQPDNRYPVSRLGSTTRIDRHYLHRWVDLEGLLLKLLQDFNLDNGDATEELLPNLVEAIGLVGSLSYASEWVSDSETAAELDQDASAPTVFEANALLAYEVGRLVRSKTMGGPARGIEPALGLAGGATKPTRTEDKALRMLDMGVGRGNTIVPVLKQVALAGIRKVSLSLLDISADSLAKTSARITRELGEANARGELTLELEIDELIEANFVELGCSVDARSARYDLVVSGGAFFHSTNKERIFDWVRQSLSPGGVLVFWDWFAACWAGPTLTVAPDDQLTADGTVSINISDFAAVEQTWLHGWLGECGYFNYWSGQDNDRINAEFSEAMLEMRAGKPFSFVTWLESVADRFLEPQKPGHYLCIEGYTSLDIYREDLDAAGMRIEAVQTIGGLKGRHGVPRLGIAGRDYYRDTIQFVTATAAEGKNEGTAEVRDHGPAHAHSD